MRQATVSLSITVLPLPTFSWPARIPVSNLYLYLHISHVLRVHNSVICALKDITFL